MSSALGIMFAVSLSASNAGWVKHESVNTFNDVALTHSEHDAIVSETGSADIWGNQGPNGVLRSWNSAAFNKDAGVFYFMGGGHSDYGGNEIYSYTIGTGTWARLNNPAPLLKLEDHSFKDGVTLHVPLNSPISSHTYDGLVWNPVTQSIWHSSTHGFGGGNGKPSHNPETPAMWEFKVDTAEWIQHEATHNFNRPMSTYLADLEKVLFIHYDKSKQRQASLYDADGNEQYLGDIEGLAGVAGVSVLFQNTETGQIYTATTSGIFEITLGDGSISAELVADYPSTEQLQFSAPLNSAAFNYRPVDGKFYIWSGGRKIVTWDPETTKFEVIWNEENESAPAHDAKGADKIFEKFVYVEDGDYFIGVQFGGDAEGSDGVWVWHPTSNPDTINQAQVAQPYIDGATQTSLSLFLPLVGGDKNFNSSVSVQYRQNGTAEWQQAMDMFRVRPDLVENTKNNTGTTEMGYAAIITGLESNRQYELKLSVSDSDGVIGEATPTLVAKTSSIRSASEDAEKVLVENQVEFEAALDNAQPGQVIQLAAGTYSPVQIKNGGTESQHLYIMGQEDGSAVIDAGDTNYGIKIDASYLQIAHLTITNATNGIYFVNQQSDVIIHSNLITNIDKGIQAKGGQRNLYIHDNTLRGNNLFGDISSKTWSDEGIVVTGNSIEVAYNTLSGFGDSIGLHWQSDLPNRAIDMHHNLIEFGGDDGIEFDFTQRNVAAHHNMITNTANGLSFQPVWGGPAIAFRNVVVNTARGPLKIKPEKDDPTGIMIINNTFLKGKSERSEGEAWKNTSGTITQLTILNNLFLSGVSDSGYTLKNNSQHRFLTMDYNGWSAEGKFQIKRELNDSHVETKSFTEWKLQSDLGNNDVMIEASNEFGTEKKSVTTLTNLYFTEMQAANDIDLHIVVGSAAIDAGTVVGGITSNFNGDAPDLGAYELGNEETLYGARTIIEYEVEPPMINDSAYTEVVFPSLEINGTAVRDSLDMSLSQEAVTLYGFAGHDYLVGSQFNDVIIGDTGSDLMNGGEGDDIFVITGTSDDADSIDGGNGFDVIVGDEKDNVFAIRVIDNIERIEGQQGYDVIRGNDYRQNFDFSTVELVEVEMIDLGAGHDIIVGSRGDDHILGGEGNDTIDGFNGEDTAHYANNFNEYLIYTNIDGSITIQHQSGSTSSVPGIVSITITVQQPSEGKDTLRNVEFLQFADKLVKVSDLN